MTRIGFHQRKNKLPSLKPVFLALVLLAGQAANASSPWKQGKENFDRISSLQRKIIDQGQALMDNYSISYTYGGAGVESQGDCQQCTLCLKNKKPASKERLKTCKICTKCSLDCSHFVQLVFEKSGLQFRYLTTRAMLNFSANTLSKRYFLKDIRQDQRLQTGDLLVYRGHVVILERLTESRKGDIIHATGGKDIRIPGQGIQRERRVPIDQFRGPLLRILRHDRLTSDRLLQSKSPKRSESAPRIRPRLRPVPQRPTGMSD